MMKRALIVGIDDYSFAPLAGCVNDANKVNEVLSENHDESPNFDCKLLTARPDEITRASLRQNIEELFSHRADVALFYFAGHGSINQLGGYLATQDYHQYDPGVSMADLLTLANESEIDEIILLIDCCHSGAIGGMSAIKNEHAVLREGVSVLTASRASQLAVEENEGGLFTALVYEAMQGGAADVLGNITTASVYAYVDRVLTAWDQRPMFKSNMAKMFTLRKFKPAVPLPILRKLPSYFETANYEYPLDPSYEPELEPKNPEHEKIFGELQKLRAVSIVEPVDEDHLYFAAIKEKPCRLTPLGQFYWKLAKAKRI